MSRVKKKLCSVCKKKELDYSEDALEKVHETKMGDMCNDCYMAKMGEEIERYPIGRPLTNDIPNRDVMALIDRKVSMIKAGIAGCKHTNERWLHLAERRRIYQDPYSIGYHDGVEKELFQHLSSLEEIKHILQRQQALEEHAL